MADQSAVDVCNQALIRVGASPITALTAATNEGRVCNTVLDSCRRAVLRAHPWNSASDRSTLHPTFAAITGCADDGSGNFRITSAAHGLSNGQRVTISGIVGCEAANSTWGIEDVTTNTFDLDASTFSGTYTSGGLWTLAAKFDYAYSIALPSGCLRVLRVNDYEDDWRIEGFRIVANTYPLDISFIADFTDYTAIDPGLYETLASFIAWKICYRLTQDLSIR